MLQSLSEKYHKHIAWPIFVLFCMQIILPVRVWGSNYPVAVIYDNSKASFSLNRIAPLFWTMKRNDEPKLPITEIKTDKTDHEEACHIVGINEVSGPAIGGPSSPEASSFKAVGSDNLVNLFTGDFSYSVPLLDVGGYPVNLFYSGGITMEQEASWVGLGWNINPGSVSRNMRGVPDDFNGQDELIQGQNVKPNRTWGGEIGIDVELIGIKKPKISLGTNLSLGFSHNNYLGPALEIGTSASITLATFENLKFEKSAVNDLNLTAGVGMKLNSRSGLTFSPSLNASLDREDRKSGWGIGLNTSYNSRTGIKDLTLHAERNVYKEQIHKEGTENQFSSSSSSSGSLGSSTFSFARTSYMPTLRMPMENSNYSAQLELGGGIFGVRGSGTINGYYSESKVPVDLRTQRKPLVGFMYSEKAVKNRNAVMDFNRVNDAEVTPNTPVISAPQYTYDIFTIQGEGTGGSIRAYRGDMGFMRDNAATSRESSASIGADMAPPGHYGGNINVIMAPTRVGGWEDDNNTLRHTLQFREGGKNSSGFENIYFRNPGETTVTSEDAIKRVGRDNLVRFKLEGSNLIPRLTSVLEQFNKKTNSDAGTLAIANNTLLTKREQRSQVVNMLNGYDAMQVGLDKQIKNYSGSFDVDNYLLFDTLGRTSGYRKAHHISEIDVLEPNGMRYIYGLPVYNKVQKDYTFSVEAIPASQGELVAYNTVNEAVTGSKHMTNKSRIDGYFLSQETPAYASAFLITGLLSPDYVDITNDGITEDDLGGAVKFNYKKSADLHKWRTPRKNTAPVGSNRDWAFFNEGVRTEKKDDKANISYGEREVWYMNSIESKSMIAIFTTSSRNDAKGVTGELDGRINNTEDANKKLSRIDLYTKAEIRLKGISLAKPLKTVFFEYDYSLCDGTGDNNSGGKLTLKSVYFSYNGQERSEKDRYVFGYGGTAADNPDYKINASDRWGTYKDPSDGTIYPSGVNNIDHPYTSGNKSKNDQFAGAWSLKKILLPSGGQMEVEYEADDYAYVQNRRACNMFAIQGLGNTTAYNSTGNMYNAGINSTDNYYVYIKLPEPLTGTTTSQLRSEIFSKYLEGHTQLALKLRVRMPKGEEPLTVYSEIDAGNDSYGVCSNSGTKEYIYIKLKPKDGKSPLAKAAISFLTENIPGQAFEGYEQEIDNIGDFLNMVPVLLDGIKNAFKNVDNQMRSVSKARQIIPVRSFIRLNVPNRIKYGGGVRVKKVIVKDNWKKMTERSSNPSGSFTSVYGQEYDYTTTEKINGIERVISSGVASYEPGIGGEENPFREIIQFKSKMPFASALYGAIEMPLLDGFYPSAGVGYSKVTVRSIHRKGTHGDSAVRSAIGKQVTEFFTAKDYPSYSTYTPLKTMEYKKNPFFSFLYKEVINRKVTSQGFLVETNDMHGKMKSQQAYSQNDEKTPLSASFYTYKNTGKNGMNDRVDFVDQITGGIVTKGNIGIDIELMTDVREFRIESEGVSMQMQSDIFPFLAPFAIFTLFPLKTYQENRYRAVTCTKLINYHAIEDSVIVMDKGSIISTKTMAYDAETGSAIVTKTANEFRDPIYNVSYPAHWAYSVAGAAYKNINRVFENVNFLDGRLTTAGIDVNEIFESGDELYIMSAGNSSSGCVPPSEDAVKIWAFDRNKNNTALTVTDKDIVFIDSKGMPYTRTGVYCKIIRSGKRNTLGLTAASLTAMKDPIKDVGSGVFKLRPDATTKVVSSAATDFKERWQADEDVFLRRTYYLDACGFEVDSINCNDELERNINPYLKGLLGTLRSHKAYTYYGDRNETDPSVNTAIRKNGYINNYSNYWDFDVNNLLVPATSDAKWVWNSELTKINAKGQELETKDALLRYTAAQYGFNKNMAVAMVQNARYGESFSEGFEDNGYEERLNKKQPGHVICEKKYIDFSGLSNGTIVSSETEAVRAHSGKKYLKVNTNSSVIKALTVRSSYKDDYHFDFPIGDINTFIPGSNGTAEETVVTPSQPLTVTYPKYTLSNLNMRVFTQATSGGASQSPLLTYNGTTSTYYSTSRIIQYVKILENGTYHFSFMASQSAGSYPGVTPTSSTSSLNFYIQDLDDNYIYTLSPQVKNSTDSDDIYLACGIYKITSWVVSEAEVPGNYPNYFILNQSFNSETKYTSNVIGITGSYVSCTYNKPIPAKDSMLNVSNFEIEPGKKMYLSAWVKEACSVPCTKTTYDKSSIIIQSNLGNTTLEPTGTIIEGWQKIEGEFTVPALATSASLVFKNINTGGVMYVDDIRIHPFNANMKSYAYDSRTLRLSAELDENNYASFYEYDEEGQLVRVKKETIEGIKTIKESRTARQKGLTTIQ